MYKLLTVPILILDHADPNPSVETIPSSCWTIAQEKQIRAVMVQNTVPKRRDRKESHFFCCRGMASMHHDGLVWS